MDTFLTKRPERSYGLALFAAARERSEMVERFGDKALRAMERRFHEPGGTGRRGDHAASSLVAAHAS